MYVYKGNQINNLESRKLSNARSMLVDLPVALFVPNCLKENNLSKSLFLNVSGNSRAPLREKENKSSVSLCCFFWTLTLFDHIKYKYGCALSILACAMRTMV